MELVVNHLPEGGMRVVLEMDEVDVAHMKKPSELDLRVFSEMENSTRISDKLRAVQNIAFRIEKGAEENQ